MDGADWEGVMDASWNLWVGLPAESKESSMKCSSGMVIVVGADCNNVKIVNKRTNNKTYNKKTKRQGKIGHLESLRCASIFPLPLPPHTPTYLTYINSIGSARVADAISAAFERWCEVPRAACRNVATAAVSAPPAARVTVRI